MSDILCLGEPLMELNQQPDGRYLPGYGGDTSNCAIAAARQGASVGYITQLGADRFGDEIMQLWQQEGVDTSHVEQVTTAPTGLYFVTHDNDGHHFSYYRQGSASSLLRADQLPAEKLKATKILHVSGISQGISDCAAECVSAAMKLVREAGGRVSYDSNLRLQLWPLEQARKVIHAAMAECDIALPGFDDAKQLTGLNEPEAIVDFYLDLGASLVALTLGEEGTLVATTEQRQSIAALPVTPIDATGAGDTFDGAFLSQLANDVNPFDAARYANAAAALSTQGFGATAPIPHRQQVEEFLQSSGTA